MDKIDYKPPVDKLLVYGDCRAFTKWPDYLALGFGKEHIPDLIRMATDMKLNMADSESLEVWAPVHAWRLLGQLKAEEAVEPLLGLLRRIDENDDDWVQEELPDVLGKMGPNAIPAMTDYLADRKHGLFARGAAARSLEIISQEHPENRDNCVDILAKQLELFKDNDSMFNGLLIGMLVDLEATEKASLIEQVFEADKVDENVTGTWEDVQIELGLLERYTVQEQIDHEPETLESRLLASRTHALTRRKRIKKLKKKRKIR